MREPFAAPPVDAGDCRSAQHVGPRAQPMASVGAWSTGGARSTMRPRVVASRLGVADLPRGERHRTTREHLTLFRCPRSLRATPSVTPGTAGRRATSTSTGRTSSFCNRGTRSGPHRRPTKERPGPHSCTSASRRSRPQRKPRCAEGARSSAAGRRPQRRRRANRRGAVVAAGGGPRNRRVCSSGRCGRAWRAIHVSQRRVTPSPWTTTRVPSER